MTRQLDSKEALEAMLAEESAVLYKHSTRCPACGQARRHIIRLIKRRPEIPVYVVDVLAHREWSQEAAQRLGVRHESPQVIVIGAGRAVWHASHYGVRLAAIEDAIGPLMVDN